MRVISLVPSWTETLLAAGVDVVGRTRFCIHPQDATKSIPVVGGTKDWNWEKIVEINPDLILLDKDENPKFMSEQNSFKWHASHVRSASDMPSQLNELAQILSCPQLNQFSDRWKHILSSSKKNSVKDLPGLIEWGRQPDQPIKHVLYLIWKNPWMAAGQDTFIGSMLSLFGVDLLKFETQYPEIDLEKYSPKETLLLFSSEPYPFLKKKAELSRLAFPYAFVDGECFSWFGIRSLEFLELNFG